MYLFAKEASPLIRLRGFESLRLRSFECSERLRRRVVLGARREGFETRLSIFCESTETKYPIVDTGSVRTEIPSVSAK